MAIRETASGSWQVDVQVKGRKRFRASYPTHDEALTAERDYKAGKEPTIPGGAQIRSGRPTLRDLYSLAFTTIWDGDAKCTPAARMNSAIEKYWGWDREAESITSMDIVNWRSHMQINQKNKPNTVNKKVSYMSSMYKAGQIAGLISTTPNFVRSTEDKNERMRWFEKGEEAPVLKFIEREFGVVYRLYFEALLETGCRVSELLGLTWRDVRIDAEKPFLSAWQTKSGTSRHVPLTPAAVAVFRRLREVHPVEERDRCFPIQQQTINKAVWNRVREAFNDYDPQFVPHCFRHTRATRLIQAGVDVDTVRQWLGHTTIQTTMRYVHFNTSKYDAAMEKLAATGL